MGPRFTLQLISSIGLIALLGSAVHASAQDSAGASGARRSRIEEIVVTAEKRETIAQETPVALSVFGGAQLDAAGYYDFEDISTNIPNVQFGRNLVDGGGFTIRGISSSSGDRSTAFHIDGIYVNSLLATQELTFFDVRRVEVLRGPQGTLYGRNATGGSINVVSNPPGPDYEAKADIQFGTYDQILGRGMFNIPLIDDLLYTRVAIVGQTRDGFQRNLAVPDSNDFDADDANTFAVRTQARFIPTESLELTLRYNYSETTGVGPGQKILGDFGDAIFVGRNEMSDGFLTDFYRNANENPRDNRKIFLDTLGEVNNADHMVNGQLTWDLPELPILGETQIKVLGSYLHRREFIETDQDGSDANLVAVFTATDSVFDRQPDPTSPVGFNLTRVSGCDPTAVADGATPDEAGCVRGRDKRREIVAEVQWSSAGDGDFDWLLGGFYLDARYLQKPLAITRPLPFVIDPPTGDGLSFIQTPVLTQEDRNDSSFAVFGQASYRLGGETTTFWDDFTVTLGARYSRDKKNSTRQTPTVLVLGNVVQAQIDVDDTQTWDAFTFLGRLAWDWSENNSAYFSVSRGYKAGFINTALSNPEDPLTSFENADPEFILAYELGSKNRFFDDRLQANLTGFYYDYEDLQVSQLAGVSIVTQNAAQATVWGLEAEILAKPLAGWVDPFWDQLSLTANLGYLNATYDEFDECFLPEAFAFIDCSGNDLVRAPPYTLTFIANWPFDLGSWGTVTPFAQLRFSGKTFFRPANCPNETCANPGPSTLGPEMPSFNEDAQESYELLNLRLTWTSENGHFQATAFVDNVTDRDVIQSQVVGSNQIGSPIQVRFDPPRTAGVRLGYSF